MFKKIRILLVVLLGLLRKPRHVFKFIRVLKNNGLTALKAEMIAFIDKKHSYSTRLEFARVIFAKEQSEYSAEVLKFQVKELAYQPLISIILLADKSSHSFFKKCIQSVQRQAYTNWQLCFVDNASNHQALTQYFRTAAKHDTRIKCKYLEKKARISEALNHALSLSSGEFITLLHLNDELTADALYWIVKTLNQNRTLDYLYTNECQLSAKGMTSNFVFKPNWSPEFLLNNFYTGKLSVYRKSLVNQVGRFQIENDFSQGYDLALRVTELTDQIAHIDRVLYLSRRFKDVAAGSRESFNPISRLAVLEAAGKRRGLNAEASNQPYASRLKLKLNYTEKVSIIIPSDNIENITTAVKSLFAATDYPNYEVIVVTKTVLAQQLGYLLTSFTSLKFCPYDLPYNFSDKCNTGAASAAGEILVFYNDDVFPIADNWLKELVECLYIKGVGGVSPKLLYQDRTIQYAGMYNGIRQYDFTTTVHIQKTDADCYSNYYELLNNTGILSGACVAIRKSVFDIIKGFDAVNTPARHSDLDLSFKIREQDLRCVYTPYSALWHIGNHSWRSNKQDKSVIFCLNRWGSYMAYDPYITKKMQSLLRLQDEKGFAIHAKNNKHFNSEKPCILLVSHDLTNTGAPRALYLLAEALKEDHNLMLISPDDGPLRAMFERLNIPVIIDDLLLVENKAIVAQQLAKDFDLVIANTIICAPFVNGLPISLKLLWWIHEGELVKTYLNTKPQYKICLQQAKYVYTVSEYSKRYINAYRSGTTIINLGIPDKSQLYRSSSKKEKLVLTMVGSLSPRKGQDLLIRLAGMLPKSYQDRVEFNLIGCTAGQEAFFNTLEKSIQGLDCIKYLGPMNHEQVLNAINEANALICLSRDEPLPTVSIEAWMLGKPCILAKTAGASQFIDEGKNGFSIDILNLSDLLRLLENLIDHPELLADMSENARDTFLKNFTFEKFALAWQTEIKSHFSAEV